MMILLLGQFGGLAHEIPRLLEIGKYKRFLKGIAVGGLTRVRVVV